MFNPNLQVKPQGEGYVAPVKPDNSIAVAGINLLGKAVETAGEVYQKGQDEQLLGDFVGSKPDRILVEEGDIDLKEAHSMLNLTQLEAARQQGVPASQLNTMFDARLKASINSRPDMADKLRQTAEKWFGKSSGGSSGSGLFKKEKDEQMEFLQGAYEAQVKDGALVYDPDVWGNKEKLSNLMTSFGRQSRELAKAEENIQKNFGSFVEGMPSLVGNINASVIGLIQKSITNGTLTEATLNSFIDSKRASLINKYSISKLPNEDRTYATKLIDSMFDQYKGENLKKIITGQTTVEQLQNRNKTNALEVQSALVAANPELSIFMGSGMLSGEAQSALAPGLLTGRQAELSTFVKNYASSINSDRTPDKDVASITHATKYIANPTIDPKNRQANLVSFYSNAETKLTLKELPEHVRQGGIAAVDELDKSLLTQLTSSSLLEMNEGVMPEGEFKVSSKDGNPTVYFEGKGNYNRKVMGDLAKRLTASVRANTILSGGADYNADLLLGQVNNRLLGGTPLTSGEMIGRGASAIDEAFSKDVITLDENLPENMLRPYLKLYNEYLSNPTAEALEAVKSFVSDVEKGYKGASQEGK